ncbi:hypothetical protein LOD99_14129 [Oopsacas minuta]|uniref:Fe2OG dioxygenase domain-containing protein n=1 Tax=Oopsacas minuta TaxID=111878 RepID=A0AAV7KI25_9METZ|nr:hypothetical protein LOD99_14129 [Oopsacas minuta]
MATEGIPTIDITHFIADTPILRDDVIKQWDLVFRNYGFCIITGHGINDEYIDNLYKKSLDFFRLPEADKMKFYLGKGYGVGGYVPRGIEMVSKSVDKEAVGQPDLVENICFTMNTIPTHTDVCLDEIVPEFTVTMHNYFLSIRQLAQIIMKISALALNLDPSYFSEIVEKIEISLRLAYYAKTEINESTKNAQRYGAHTDYGGFTILKTDDYQRADKCHSLEVDHNGTWLPVISPQNSFIINSGDLIERWTNGIWKSATHRVINNNLDNERLSMVFFTTPHHDTIIDTLPGTYKDDKDKLYEPISAGEHLKEKLMRTTVKK